MSPLAAVVDEYIRDHQEGADHEQRWFAVQRDLRSAVEVAALAQSPGGKRLSHQWRIPGRVLQESHRRLIQKLPELKKARSFDAIFDLVAATIDPIRGIGELAVYDTAVRIAAYRSLEPTKVYLHAGTRKGARKLGLPASVAYLEVSQLPAEFRRLKPREIEDVLCIYKHRFGPEMGQPNHARGRSNCGVSETSYHRTGRRVVC